jgi:hypothetical protein
MEDRRESRNWNFFWSRFDEIGSHSIRAIATASGSANLRYRKQFNFKDLRSLDESGRGAELQGSEIKSNFENKGPAGSKSKAKVRGPAPTKGGGLQGMAGAQGGTMKKFKRI